MRDDRPRYTRWKRRTGGVKICPACGRRHKPVARIDGKPMRVKTCRECGTELPKHLSYPKRSAVTWVVRESDPRTGQT